MFLPAVVAPAPGYGLEGGGQPFAPPPKKIYIYIFLYEERAWLLGWKGEGRRGRGRKRECFQVVLALFFVLDSNFIDCNLLNTKLIISNYSIIQSNNNKSLQETNCSRIIILNFYTINTVRKSVPSALANRDQSRHRLSLLSAFGRSW